jgi:ligand-binding SRPBCC domain-containing protein
MNTPVITREPGRFVLQSACVVPRPIDEVFTFFGDAHNLQQLTPPWLNFEILTPAPIDMKPGALIDYKLRVHRLPLRWRTRINEWQPPHRFVDEQIKGPYKRWVHEHRFEADGDSTVCHDRVEYDVPLAWIAHRLFVKPDVLKIFAYRTERLAQVFASPAPAVR